MPKLAAKEYCTGCTACASACPKGCIAMEPDENGFLCPVIDRERCIECGLCEKVCPVVSARDQDGEEPLAYAACSRDEAMRLDSSSGGVFSELARAILARGGVVYGAAYDDAYRVVHICAGDERALARLRGAKYAQSDLRGVFPDVKQQLEQGRWVLFSGTPCQVGGLKAYLRREYENLVTVDFVCHSVPSPAAWHAYVKYRAALDNGGELPKSVNLRAKKTGWSRYQYANLFEYADGRTHTAKSGESLYMKLFVGGYINRDACAHCRFKGYRRVSDLTIGDFWGIWDIAPEMDDDKGTSVVLVQSSRGDALLREVSHRLVLKAVTPEEAGRQNPAMLRAAVPNDRRGEALDNIRSGNISACEKWFAPPKVTTLQRIRRRIRRLFHPVYRHSES